MKNKLTKTNQKFLQGLSCQYGESEGKIIEHLLEAENPLKCFLEEIQFYRPHPNFIGEVFLYAGKDLNLYLK